MKTDTEYLDTLCSLLDIDPKIRLERIYIELLNIHAERSQIRDCSNCGKKNKRNCILCAPHYSTLPYWIPKEEPK